MKYLLQTKTEDILMVGINMETENLVYVNDSTIEIPYEEMTPEDKDLVSRHVELTRHFQEIRRFFKIYLYNVDLLVGTYTLYNNGKVLKDGEFVNSENHFLAINALVYNLIASGKTLLEAMDNFVCNNYEEKDVLRQKYRKYCAKVYDSSFAYRLIIRLRDYSQHGHLPVNCYNDWFGFDLHQILSKPHYNHNNKIKIQMEDAIRDTYKNFGDKPRLPLAMTLAEFTANLMLVSNEFCGLFGDSITASYKDFCDVVDRNPNNVYVHNEEGFELLIYDMEESIAQAALINDDLSCIVNQFREDVNAKMREYEKEWEELVESMIFIHVGGKESNNE